ncbi:MAG TPA: exonuclease subunit SbcD, partial [Flavobacteriales bacterium]|nr:exonuclease subunit SbcD [Flavobacteriales bacterium]
MSLRILHTADWHLGKRLHGADLSKDHLLFIEDLLSIIREREITHLLIAGDVFDHANPSNEALELYYSFIRKLLDTGCALIVTGGNHDSPGVLNAPQSLLKQLRVSVIGCATENPEDEIIELKN